MSENADRVTQAHFDYLTARTRTEPALLAELKVAAREAGIPAIAISWAQANLIQILLKLVGARRVIEVGTLAGYSGIAMAQALPADGVVTSLEIVEKHAAFAREWAARSETGGNLEVVLGNGAETLKRFSDGSFDAAFLDADKTNYPVYLEQCMRLVRRGGLIMADNAFAFGELFAADPTDRETPAIKRFNDLVPTIPGLHAMILPVGDGMWMGIRE